MAGSFSAFVHDQPVDGAFTRTAVTGAAPLPPGGGASDGCAPFALGGGMRVAEQVALVAGLVEGVRQAQEKRRLDELEARARGGRSA